MKKFIKIILKTSIVLIILSIFVVWLLKIVNPPTTSFMLQKRSQLLLDDKKSVLHYKWLDFDQISRYMKIAVIASEDQKFPVHHGLDYEAIEKAMIYNDKKHQPLRGASTITQQVAKNLFLWSGRSYIRKGLEAYFALLIELFWDKKRILTVYLNIAEMGPKIYGVGAASKIYFKKKAIHLSRSQAALLAAVLPNPKRYSVKKSSKYTRFRKKWILKQMRKIEASKAWKSL